MPSFTSTQSRLDLVHDGMDGLCLQLGGSWQVGVPLPTAEQVIAEVRQGPPVARLEFDITALHEWDSALVSFVFALSDLAAGRGIATDTRALPEGARKLLQMSRSVAPHEQKKPPVDDSVVARVGELTIEAAGTTMDATEFLGETLFAFGRFLRGKARFRPSDLLLALEQTGVGALGIVVLINFLVGGVLAFVGAVQLQQFGATIYVASLVAIGITRELGPLMTAIVMAGRTGAAFAATLGTMTVNEEVDALRTMGLKPVEFLVLPRVVATALMMPALVVFADAIGILGGMFVSVGLLDLGVQQYIRETQQSLPLTHVTIGLIKSVFFGLVVAFVGCYHGMRSGRSAAAVGQATTSAVVMIIVFVVVVDTIFTVLTHYMGV
jgi:phospholipid/cholesterol/gamma-HCH transport system permease protein